VKKCTPESGMVTAMANEERAGFVLVDYGATGQWELRVGDTMIGVRLADRLESSVEVAVERPFGNRSYRSAITMTFDQWRALCALPVLPAPAIADGTSQPWTPPAAAVPADDELGHCRVYGCERPTRTHLCDECLRDYGLAPVAESKSSGELANAHAERLRLTQRQCDAADRLIAGLGRRVGLGLELLAKGDRGGLEATLREALSMAGAGLADPQTGEPGAVSEGAEVERLTRERDEARRVGAEALTRATELEAKLATAYANVDEARDARRGSDRDRLRHELVAAAVRSGRYGVAAVRDADEAMAEMDKAAKAAAGLFDGKLAATKVRAVADTLRAFRANPHGNDGALLVSVERLDALASRLEDNSSSRAALVPPSKGPSAKAVAHALGRFWWVREYLGMAEAELTQAGGPGLGEANHALDCADIDLQSARAALRAVSTPGAAVEGTPDARQAADEDAERARYYRLDYDAAVARGEPVEVAHRDGLRRVWALSRQAALVIATQLAERAVAEVRGRLVP
jgi:hypothetical protein